MTRTHLVVERHTWHGGEFVEFACRRMVRADVAEGMLITDDPARADCLLCERRLNEDADPRPRPNPARAAGRAYRRLRDAHPDEYRALYLEELPRSHE